MAVPTAATYSLAALVAAHTAFKNLIDAGGAAGSVKIRDAGDFLLSQIALTYPCGAVSGSTGQLVLTADGRDESAEIGGTAAYGEFCDSAGLVHLSLPAQAGSSAVPGKLVLNTLTIAAGGPVEVMSATVG